MKKKFTRVEDLNLDLSACKSADEKQFMNNIASMVLEVVNKSMEGEATKEEVEASFKSINDKIKDFDADKYNQLVKDNEELCSQVKNLGETIEKLKQKGIGMEAVNKFDEKLQEMLESEKFKNFSMRNSGSSGVFDGFCLKDIVSLVNNYEGDHLITQQTNRVVSRVANSPVHLRDIITTMPGDETMPNVSFAQVEKFDKNARYLSENGRLPESSIKVKEVTAQVKRLGTMMRVSKRMLKSRVYLRAVILNMLPEAVYQAEDWNILFGDGHGENFDGIAHYAGVLPIEKIISEQIVAGSAGSVKSVSSYDKGKSIVVELYNAYDEMLDGMKVKFEGATVNTGINGTHDVIKMSDRQLLLLGVPFTGEESSTDQISFKVSHAAYKSIEEPNSGDAINTAFAVMTFAQYSPTAIVLNPIDVNAIACEKDNMGRNLGLVSVVNGVKYVGGRPIIETNQIPAGKYFLGDFNNGANLIDYSALSLEWAEDLETKATNQVVLLAQEEAILAVYMPWSFSYGDIAQLKQAITKA